MDSKNFYSLSDALEKVTEASTNDQSYVTLYGIHERCASRVAELCKEVAGLTIFKNNSTGQPSATFSFKAAV